jgi:hypothetical protein
MIVVWSDQDGDAVAVDTALIAGVSVGDVARPHAAGTSVRVTLVWVRGVGQPFMVATAFDDVVAAWKAGRETDGPAALTGAPLMGWQAQYPQIHPSGLLPDPKPAWAVKAPAATKGEVPS